MHPAPSKPVPPGTMQPTPSKPNPPVIMQMMNPPPRLRINILSETSNQDLVHQWGWCIVTIEATARVQVQDIDTLIQLGLTKAPLAREFFFAVTWVHDAVLESCLAILEDKLAHVRNLEFIERNERSLDKTLVEKAGKCANVGNLLDMARKEVNELRKSKLTLQKEMLVENHRVQSSNYNWKSVGIPTASSKEILLSMQLNSNFRNVDRLELLQNFQLKIGFRFGFS
ncbi:hypothetical protein BDV96DRAFT_658544 [Lophiotrema nucula]|uniref:Uncharacterized protein n=1 Tax=Lophiotrema nucula TaxID=690887 RepID=A0A6A5ZB67_9PLEO|nr:hypothetical protein BDV96DRAFT_658544 [Lophiotrema nucula]